MRKTFIFLLALMAGMFSAPLLTKADEVHLVNNLRIPYQSDADNDAKAMSLSCTTDADGVVIITIAKYQEGNGTTVFRDDGMQRDGFKYNGESMINYFTPSYTEGSTVFKWVPISKAAVRCGGTITFNVNANNDIQYKVGGDSYSSKQSFTYTYGAVSEEETGIGCYDSYPAGQSEYVYGALSKNNATKGTGVAYITWETLDNGDVQITLSDFDGATNTVFRNQAMREAGFQLKDGSTYHAITDYFTRVHTSNTNTLLLQKKDEVTIPSGAKITYNYNESNNLQEEIEWKINGKDYNYNQCKFEYTYGTTCPALAAPTDIAINGSKQITFTGSDGAEAYNLEIYRGENNCVWSQADIQNGGVVNFEPFVEDDYTVYLTAVKHGVKPGVSEAYNWHLTAAGTPQRNTDICHMTVNEQNINNVYLTAETVTEETDDDYGKIIFTLEGATWRGGGLAFGSFKVGNANLESYFDKNGGFENTHQMILTPKSGQETVKLGDQIRFSGTIEWNIPSGGNGKNNTQIAFSYIYGSKKPTLAVPTISSFADGVITFDPVANAETYTAVIYASDGTYTRETVVPGSNTLTRPSTNGTYQVKLIAHASCYHDSPESAAAQWVVAAPELSKPSISNIDADSVITISGDENATSYVATVSLGGVEKYTQEILLSSEDYVLHFFPWVAGDYTVTVVARAEGYSDSEPSNAYTWHLEARTVQSNVCSKQTGNGNDNYMCLTFGTDAQGNINITMSDYGSNANAAFRGSNGMDPAGFKCNGQPMTNYFDKGWNNANYATVLTWIPKTSGDYIPQYGDIITFNKYSESKNIEWYIGLKTPSGSQYSFEYIYGTSCPSLSAPVITKISASKAITFVEVDGAENYKLSIYRDGLLVYTQADISNGATINYDPWVEENNTVYSVYLIAQAPDMQPAKSAPYEWIMAASREPLPLSEVDKLELSTDNGGVYLTIKTGADRRIILTLSGTNDPVWRGNGVQINWMTVYGKKLEDYFDKKKADGTTTYSAGESTMILVPKANCPLKYGDVISYNTTIEWSVSGATNPNTKKEISYTYGSKPGYIRNDSWMAPGELGTVCYPYGLTFAGANMYEMAGVDENGKFVFDEVDVLEPGKPYLFEATSNAVMLYKTDAAPVAEAGTSNGMVGTFEDITISNTIPNVYYFSGRHFYAVTARQTDLTVPANRAYVDLSDPQPAPAPRHGVRRITFGVEGTNTATGFDGIQGNDVPCTKVIMDGKLYILRNGRRYDATGRMVK